MTKLEWDKVAVLKPDNARDPLDASYDWPLELDTAIDEATQNGIDVALTVTGTPGWANGDKAPRYAPTDPKDYADFLTAAAKRYPGVHLWVIWDGPTQSENFQPSPRPLRAPARRRLRRAEGREQAQPRRRRQLVHRRQGRAAALDPPLKLPNGKRPRMDFYGHDAFSTPAPGPRRVTLGKGTADLSDIDTLTSGSRRLRQQAPVHHQLHAADQRQLALRLQGLRRRRRPPG